MLEIPESLQGSIDPVPLGVGIVFLLLGWVLYWGSVNLLGALVVGGLGLVITEGIGMLLPDLEPLHLVLLRGGGVIAGVMLGLFVAKLVHRVAFFVFGWLLGATFFFKGLLALGGQLDWDANDLLLAIGTPLAGLVLGFLAVWLDRWLSIIATSLLGALLVSSGVNDWNAIILIPALCAVGILLQGMICTWGEGKKKRR